MSKQIRIKSLHLQNFKGAKDVRVEFPQGNVATISGRNGTGKTTIMDAFLWLLWGLNSEDQITSKFGIKPNDKDGNTQLDLNPEVEGVLETLDTETGVIDTATFRKKWTSVWRTRSGETEREFVRNKGEYFVNDVPMGEADYAGKVNDLIRLEVFKSITNPYYFPKLKWQEKREILMSMAEQVTYADIANQQAAFAKLLNRITGKTVDEYSKEIAVKIASLSKEIDRTPGLIEEVENLTPLTPDYAALNAERAQLEAAIADIEKSLFSATERATQSQTAKANAEAEINELISLQRKILSEAEQTAWDAIRAARIDHEKAARAVSDSDYDHQRKASGFKSMRASLETQLQLAESTKDRILQKAASLRAEWNAIGGEQFSQNDRLICPIYNRECHDSTACQAYANNWIEAESQFIANREARQNEITSRGKELMEVKLVAQEAAIDSIKEQIAALDKEVEAETAAHQTARAALVAALDAAPAPTTPNIKGEDLPNWMELQGQIDQLRLKLQWQGEPAENPTAGLEAKRKSHQTRLDEVKRKIGLKDTIERMQNRKAELQERQNKLLQERASLQKEQATMEAMTKARMTEVENRINKMFKYVRFQMFEPTATTDDEKPNCVIWIGPVRYQDANRARRVNAGIDIINTLCEHHQVTAPIFLDNAECVNEFIPTESQLILLKVSEKELKVE